MKPRMRMLATLLAFVLLFSFLSLLGLSSADLNASTEDDEIAATTDQGEEPSEPVAQENPSEPVTQEEPSEPIAPQSLIEPIVQQNLSGVMPLSLNGESITWTPVGRTVLDAVGRVLEAGEFDFQLSLYDEAKDSYTEIGVYQNNADGTITFPAFTFDASDVNKTYTYRMRELAGSEAGMSYSQNVVHIDVEITLDASAELAVSSSYYILYDDGLGNLLKQDIPEAVFLNTATPVATWTPEGKKILHADGRPLLANEFSFALTVLSDDGQKHVLIGYFGHEADGTINFPTLYFYESDLGKTHRYRMQEVVPATPETDMTYDPHVVHAEVYFEQDAAGNAIAKSRYYYYNDESAEFATNVESAVFENTYKEKAEWTPVGRKHLVASRRHLQDNEFQFELSRLDNATGNYSEIGTYSHNAGGIINFQTITIDPADYGKTITYRMRELAGSEDGMSYASNVVYCDVLVTRDVSHKLRVSYRYYAFEKNKSGNQVEVDLNDAYFVNTYVADGDWTPVGRKILLGDGRPLQADEFRFELSYFNELKNLYDTIGIYGHDADGTINFPTIGYSEASVGKTYLYRITEEYVSLPGITQMAADVYVDVTVALDASGKLVSTPFYYQPFSDLDGNLVKVEIPEAVFHNVHYADGEYKPHAKKILHADGRLLKENEFKFVLTKYNEMTNEHKVIGYCGHDADGKINLPTIYLYASDVGREDLYTIQEIMPDIPETGMIYDEHVAYFECYYQQDSSGTVTAIPLFYYYNEAGERVNTGTQAVFENTFAPSARWTPHVTKHLTGRPLEAGEFTFALYKDGVEIEKVVNDDSGNVTFSMLVYDDGDLNKTYEYTIEEVVPTAKVPGVTYDPKVITVTVDIVEENGELIAIAHEPDDLTFNNAYHVTRTWTPLGTKILYASGRALVKEEFSFELTKYNVDTKERDLIGYYDHNADGTINLPAFTFDETDVGEPFPFRLREVIPDILEPGMTYDTHSVYIDVSVKHGAPGELDLIVTYFYINEAEQQMIPVHSAVFENSFLADGEWRAEGEKILIAAGRKLKEDEFKFDFRVLNEATNNYDPVETCGHTAEGAIKFPTITFDIDDVGKTYIYRVTEIAGSEPGMNYSWDMIHMAVKVELDAMDRIVASARYYRLYTDDNGNPLEVDVDKITFYNEHYADASWTPDGEKILHAGRPLAANEFLFELTRYNPATMEDELIGYYGHDADGKINFPTLYFFESDVGSASYSMREIQPATPDPNMVYDTHTVTAQLYITKDASGQVIVTPLYYYIDESIATVISVDNAVFENRVVEPAKCTPIGEKILHADGRLLETNAFLFELNRYDYNKDAYDLVGHYGHDAAGTINFPTLLFTAADAMQKQPIHYRMHEVTPYTPEPHMTYDSHFVYFDVDVSVDALGKVNVDPVYYYIDEPNQVLAYPDKAVFENTYEPTAEWTPHVKKILVGRTLEAGDFFFELQKDGVLVEKVSNDALGEVIFSTLVFTQDDVGKSYEYTIHEIVPTPQEPDMTYDTKVITFAVDVVDDNGELKAIVDEPFDLVFINMKLKEGEWIPLGQKVFNAGGRTLKEDEFTFELSLLDEAEGQYKAIGTDYGHTEGGTIKFPTITFTDKDVGQTFYYRLREIAGSESGMFYGWDVYDVVVEVAKDVSGTLIVTAKYYVHYDDGIFQPFEFEVGFAVFMNTYEAKGEWRPEVHKVLSGRVLADDEFQFKIDVPGNPGICVATNKADGTIPFAPLTYTEQDIGQTYVYTISEVVPATPEDGMSYDPLVITVPVTISDAGNGVLNVVPSYPKDTTFNNRVKQGEDNVQIEVYKVLVGRTLTAGEFSFNLVNKYGVVIETATNAIDGTVAFTPLYFTEADIGEVFEYKVHEVLGSEPGMTYSTQLVSVSVHVTADGNGAPVASLKYDVGDAGELHFVNTYKAYNEGEASATILVFKSLTGRALTDGEFSFELVDEKDGTVIRTATNDADGTVTFPTLYFTAADIGKVFDFSVHEVHGTEPGMTYSTEESFMSVHVTDDGSGAPVATLKYVGDLGDYYFYNTYEAPVEGDDSATILVFKTLTGRALTDGEFSFALVDEKDGTVIETATNDADGKVTFPTLYFTAADIGKVFEYRVHEVHGTEPGMTYSTEESFMSVHVTDDGSGAPIATLKYVGDLADYYFYNTYEAPEEGDDSVTIIVFKVLHGRTLTDGAFSFELVDANGKVVESVTNKADGTVTFTPLVFTQDDIGKVFDYSVHEVQGTEAGMTYSTAESFMSVHVSDDGSGAPIASITYADRRHFFNAFEAPEVGDVSVTLEVAKVLLGRTLAAGEFSFELMDKFGTVIETVTNKADGKITFSPVVFTKADIGKVFIYTIQEIPGTEAGMTYETGETLVFIYVSADVNGAPVANITYAGVLHFVNRFEEPEEPEDSITIEVFKVLEGRALTDGAFSFELVDENDKVIETVTNKADGTITFTPLVFTKADIGEVFKYKVYEVHGSEDGMTYSTEVVLVYINVSADANGAPVAGITYAGERHFINKFEKEEDADTSATIEVYKELQGRALTAGEFNFALTDEFGTIIETVTNKADGTVTFTPLFFTKADIGEVFKYKVHEIPGTETGMTYSMLETLVYIVVTYDYSGAPVVGITYAGERHFINRFEKEEEADTSVTIEVFKELQGRALTAGEFNFELVDENDKVIETVTNKADGTVVFTPLVFTKANSGDVFEYKVHEVPGTETGMTYSSAEVLVYIDVSADANGAPVAGITYAGERHFINKYKEEEEADTSVTIEVFKVLQGRALTAGEFSFELVDENDKVIETVTNKADGTVVFKPLVFTKTNSGDVFAYKVHEVPGTETGMTYSSAEVLVYIDVSADANGAPVAGITYAGERHFINTYEARGSITPEGQKILISWQDLVADQFSFELLDADHKVLATYGHDAAGKINFAPLSFTEADIGKTFTYYVHEVFGGDPHIGYFPYDLSFTVTVADAGAGELALSIDHEPEDGLVFFNYGEDLLSPVLDPVVEKRVDGAGAPADAKFVFELRALTPDTPIQKGNVGSVLQHTLTGPGTFGFGEIYFKPVAGVYRYEVVEIKGDTAGFTYDETVFTLDVEIVWDDAAAQFELVSEIKKVGLPVKDIVFTNHYKETPPDDIPKTGEAMTHLPWLGILLLGGAASLVAFRRKKKTR